MPHPHRFLIVDDDEDNRYLARHALLKAFPGARIDEAGTAATALAAAGRDSFDGVVTDHHLGAVDGAAFMGELRAAGIDCPVVMVTASSDPAVHRRAREAGAACVICGPDWDFVSYFQTRLWGPDRTCNPRSARAGK